MCIAGSGGSGALGNGQDTYSDVPVAISGEHILTALDAGAAFTCALDASGRALCWGEWPIIVGNAACEDACTINAHQPSIIS